MSRRHSAEKRQVLADPKFKDIIVTKFMNQIMRDGKKSVAERIVYGAFDLVETRAKKNPVEVFHAGRSAHRASPGPRNPLALGRGCGPERKHDA